jgi:hypothetical protein
VSKSAARTRFTIRTQEQISELFSIRERASGDLIIIPKHATEFEENSISGIVSNIVEDRVSIHVSPNSTSNLFIFHSSLTNKISRSIYTTVSPRHGRLVWPLAFYATSDLSSPTFKCNFKPNDHKIDLGFYNPHTAMLCYFIVISHKSQDIMSFRDFNTAAVDFSYFRITLFWTFSKTKSLHQASMLYPMTHALTISQEGQIRQRFVESQSSLERAEFIHSCRRAISHLIEQHIIKTHRYRAPRGITTPRDFALNARTIYPTPSI